MQAAGLKEIIELEEYFVGENYGNGQFSCMHGPGECVGDQLSLCANYYYNQTGYKWWDFGVCLQGQGYQTIPQNAKQCATTAGIDYAKISACQAGKLGDTLFAASIAYANQVGIYATPTTIIAGQQFVGGANNPLKVICDAYTGAKPAGCSNADIAGSSTKPALTRLHDHL